MAVVKFELPFEGMIEPQFAKSIEEICTIKVADVRDLVHLIKMSAEAYGLKMVLGCGGSHIWIHRASQFIPDGWSQPGNERWAIITED